MGFFSGITKAVKSFFSPTSVIGTIASNPLVQIGGSLLGGYLQNSSNQSIAANQQAFQAYQSATSYQRAVADMRKAGLNPLLAYQQGGASTPQGASIPAVDMIGGAVHSARASERLKADLKNLQEVNKQIQANTFKAKADAVKSMADVQNQTNMTNSNVALNNVLQAKAIADTSLSANSARTAAANAQIAEAEIPKFKNREEVEESGFGKAMRWLDRVGESVGSFFGGTARARATFGK
jgi:hypothetical protein